MTAERFEELTEIIEKKGKSFEKFKTDTEIYRVSADGLYMERDDFEALFKDLRELNEYAAVYNSYGNFEQIIKKINALNNQELEDLLEELLPEAEIYYTSGA